MTVHMRFVCIWKKRLGRVAAKGVLIFQFISKNTYNSKLKFRYFSVFLRYLLKRYIFFETIRQPRILIVCMYVQIDASIYISYFYIDKKIALHISLFSRSSLFSVSWRKRDFSYKTSPLMS